MPPPSTDDAVADLPSATLVVPHPAAPAGAVLMLAVVTRHRAAAASAATLDRGELMSLPDTFGASGPER
ncbi:hypothetical protein GCM10011609_09420 [Lentzea pudingi]|uniref:Uncharacterized protein n=1 Tax=Lentzea pudingi TaxID=1789439 RepID=A0ABQ2HDV3_9PSEU|nr:hypothetical protein GCM10011609_09420 [Lentzea pudingi]